MSNEKPLEESMPLASFSDFIKAVPERWRSAPLYIRCMIDSKKAVNVILERDELGRRIVVLSCEFTELNPPIKPKIKTP